MRFGRGQFGPSVSRGGFPFEQGAIPACEIGPRFVSALRELQDFGTGRCCAAHIVVHQHEVVQFLLIERTPRSNRLPFIGRWFGGRVGVESRARHVSAPWPPTQTAAFMGVSFRRDNGFSGRSGTAAKTRASEIEAAPKEMNRTLFA